mmetsp:Transcript_658/g.1201  ORF Transcript_658/g.1201 Transcript_658/m.1201 type:complete len:272 (+) Transcript_658:77-892(+)|eukprot:CAMPEP_0201633074 /NCGR_PEP_ID=MMETSP0493-20130528/6494_1 /ASSEMBLY_ACC=CAM_ASM_000838 /TAXON_ID=420259 /ORGANISM="Thalassiosira gravida, Strain GMp14c1" /LENGTH=271 /DNA_ID=CAMNT_0048104711 /DNA_START=45 /DNA_END=860 /DNA_ORIENTATION=+
MVSAPLTAAIVAIVPLTQSAGPLLASAFTTSHFTPIVQRPSSPWALSAGGKGFGEKPPPKQKSSSPSTTTETLSPASSTDESYTPRTPEVNTGSKLLSELRSREAEKRDEELRKLRELRETDALLKEDGGAAAIPERVAQRMGKRMVPFVGIPLFGSFASFIGFWYLAVYKDMEFQPAVVATTSFGFLAIGLLGITYSVVSSSWDNDRDGSVLGVDEFQKNVGSLRDGLSRTKENAVLREKMMGLSEDEIQRAIDGQEKRDKNNKKDAWME